VFIIKQFIYKKIHIFTQQHTLLHLSLPNSQVCLKDVAFENTLGDTVLELSFSCTLKVDPFKLQPALSPWVLLIGHLLPAASEPVISK